MRAQEIIGQTICDTYVVEEVIGTGTMGMVLKVRHVRLPKRFAMKVLHGDRYEGSEAFARFRREAEIASSLGHPNIVDVVDWNRLPDNTPFLIMEYLQGEDLHTRLLRHGSLPLLQVLELGRQVGSALSAAHKLGVVHRDLKPQNIFLCREDRGEEVVEVAKVLDFGISKIMGDRGPGSEGSYTGAMRVMGTPLYMAPEQAMGLTANVDGRADQFSLATILYHALTERRPFEGGSVVEIALKVMSEEPQPLQLLAPGLPENVYAAIGRALQKERELRFPTIGEFVRALCGVQTSASLVLQPVAELPPPPPRPSHPEPALTSLPMPALPVLPSGPGAAATPAPEPTHSGTTPRLTGGSLFGQGLFSGLVLVLLALLGAVPMWAATRALSRSLRPPPLVPPSEEPRRVLPTVRPPTVPQVTLSFAVTPPNAEIYLDGKRVDGRVQVPRSEVGLHLEVKAPGHQSQTDTVVPTSDQRILIRLAPKRRSSRTIIPPF